MELWQERLAGAAALICLAVVFAQCGREAGALTAIVGWMACTYEQKRASRLSSIKEPDQ